MADPVVSVMIPTWQRRHTLFSRCLPSVAAQTLPENQIEVIVCSDGPDPELQGQLPSRIRYHELPERHGPEFCCGDHVRAKMVGQAHGKYIACLDDDDEWLPDHLSSLVDLLEDDPDTGFAYGQARMFLPQGGEQIIGQYPPCLGGISTSTLVVRRETYEVANWQSPDSPYGDWELCSKWLAAGARPLFHEQVTVRLWPESLWHGAQLRAEETP